jgi:rhodanese-related sulfurtransferase
MSVHRILLSASVLLLGVVFTSCDSESQNAEAQSVSIREVGPAEAEKILSESTEIQLVDVRTRGEVDRGFIAGASHIDYMQWEVFTAGVKNLDKSKPVMLYCKVGGRSHKAAQYLVENGFTEVYDLRGGIVAWKNEGKPLQKH